MGAYLCHGAECKLAFTVIIALHPVAIFIAVSVASSVPFAISAGGDPLVASAVASMCAARAKELVCW